METNMKHLTFLTLLSCLLTIPIVQGQAQSKDIQTKINEAMSAAPLSISKNATILDSPIPGGEKVVLREGTNEWTCFPDNPNMPGKNPRCFDPQAMKFFQAVADRREPNITGTGFAYFLQGGGSRSNANPWDTSPTPDNEWMEMQVPHIVLITPDTSILEGLPTKMDNGGPWVMWGDTPYAHIMIPVPKNIQE